MASKCKQPKATKCILADAAQTVLQLEEEAVCCTVTGATEDLELLLNVGLSVNTICRNVPGGTSLLHIAAGLGHTQIVLLLLRLGADKSIVAGLLGTPLHQAVGHGHVSTVKAMIKEGCPVDVVDRNGDSVLHFAAKVSNAEVMNAVLSTGFNINATCDINATDNDGQTPLHVAAGSGNTETALELIGHGANKAIVSGLVGTPLHQAALQGHASTVKRLLMAGCPVDVVSSIGVSVLHAAARGGNAEVIKELLTCTECKINATDNDGGTPLHVAALYGKREAALELIRHGANWVIVAGPNGTPLHQAAVNGHVSTVKAMIKAGCPVDVVASNGATVLHFAAQGGNDEVIKKLLTHTECEIDATDNNGGTALHVAAGDVSAVKAGCPVNVVDNNGASVLHYAAQSGNAGVIRQLLSTGCDINATDNYGWLPLNWAARNGNLEALQELIRCEMAQKGCVKSVYAVVDGWTPLHHAVCSKSKECVRILLERGADPMKVSPYLGSPYNCAAIFAPTVIEAFDNFIVEEDESLPCMHVLRDPLLSWYVPMEFFRHSFLEKDTFGISQLEYSVVWFQFPDEVVLRMHELSLVSQHNLLLLAAIHGQCKYLHNLTHGSAIQSSFTAYTVTSLVNFNYCLGKMPQYHKLVPPDATLNLLHVALLSLKGRTSGEVFIEGIRGDQSSLLKLLVTSDSFRHTLHEYLPNGLTPLDLAEKLGLGNAVSIISSAGGRYGIYAMVSEEVRLQHGPAILLVHQELMKLESSGALGQQAVQAVLSQLPGRTTVEQGTATDESYICQQKLLDQRPKLNILSNYIVSKFNVVRWRLLGTSLEVSQEVLSHISSTHSCCEDRYLEVLVYWLSHNEAANWRTLLEVLGNFETKNTLDRLTQEVLATEDSQIPPNSTTHHSEPSQHCPAEVGAALPPPSPQLSPQFIFNVVHHVGVHWYKFALHLGIGPRVLDVVRVEKQHLISDCCQESLHRWLKHDRDTGEKEREVGVVLEAVRRVCGPATVERIQSDWQSKRDRQPASPASLLLSIPELVDVEELVVPFAAAQWEAVADYLQVSYEKRAVIAASERGCVEVHCLELFKQWLQQLPGTGPLPRTWEEVLDIMGEAIGTEVAKQIRTKLDSKYGAVPCLPTQSGPTLESAALLQQDTSRTAQVDPLRGELLSSKPTAVLLLKKVVPAIAQEWLQIGVHLEMEVSLLKTFKATASHDLKLCCLEMFECWLQDSSGTGESPRTWSTVLSAVRECLGHDVADGIERALLEERRQRR